MFFFSAYFTTETLLHSISPKVPFTDLVDAAKCVVKALFIREKYINQSMQNFCKTTAHALLELGMKPLDPRIYDDIAETPVDAGTQLLILTETDINRYQLILLNAVVEITQFIYNSMSCFVGSQPTAETTQFISWPDDVI